MPLSLVIFTDIVPLRHRPKWYGFVLGAWALGNCLGPVLGGVLAEKTTWRWIFYIMFPFCGLGLLLVIKFLTLNPPRATLRQKLDSIDWVGAFLFIPSGTLFLIAVSWGGVQLSWSSPGTLVPLCLGTLGFVATFLYELRFATKPFLQRSLFWGTSPSRLSVDEGLASSSSRRRRAGSRGCCQCRILDGAKSLSVCA